MEYGTDILSLLQSFELQRVAWLKKFGLIALIVVLLNILFFIKFRSNFLPSLLFGFIILVGSYYILNTKYKKQLQNALIPKLIEKVDPNFRWEKDKKIDIELLNRLKIFSHKIETITSDGEVILQDAGKKVNLSFVILESMKIDTEEGEHFTKRFDGLIIELKLGKNYNQKYLLGEGEKRAEFEAGDYINPPYMGLKFVGSFGDFSLYSEDGESRLEDTIVQKLIEFKKENKKDFWAIFEKDRVYILVDDMHNTLEFSLFQTLETQNFILEYVKLLKNVKKLI